MIELIECAGQPRDMGQDQGSACRDDVAEVLTRSGLPSSRGRFADLRPFTTGQTRGAGVGRELIRHFTHLSERIDGLARKAGVPVDSVFELHARAMTGEVGAESVAADARVVAGPALDGASGVALLRGLPVEKTLPDQWRVRRSRPEVGFASVEVTLPWFVSAVAGVNSAGVCVGLSPVRGALSQGRLAGPSHLLVQECLQRFEDIAACIDWCLKRQVSGDVTLVLGDARGGLATVDFKGGERIVHHVESDLIGADSRGIGDESVSGLGSPGEPIALDAAQSLVGPDSASGAAFVRIDAATRTLTVRSLGDRVDTITVQVSD